MRFCSHIPLLIEQTLLHVFYSSIFDDHQHQISPYTIPSRASTYWQMKKMGGFEAWAWRPASLFWMRKIKNVLTGLCHWKGEVEGMRKARRGPATSDPCCWSPTNIPIEVSTPNCFFRQCDCSEACHEHKWFWGAVCTEHSGKEPRLVAVADVMTQRQLWSQLEEAGAQSYTTTTFRIQVTESCIGFPWGAFYVFP